MGQRRSYPATCYLGYIFGKLKMRAVVVGSALGNDEEVLHLARRNDAAISISFTPYASATVDWTRILADKDRITSYNVCYTKLLRRKLPNTMNRKI